jgi:hypothetical protein
MLVGLHVHALAGTPRAEGAVRALGLQLQSCRRTRPEIDAAFATIRSQRAATYVDKILKGQARGPARRAAHEPSTIREDLS